jgi:hypothetical protein
MADINLIKEATRRAKAILAQRQAEEREAEINDAATELAIKMSMHDSLVEAVEGNKITSEQLTQAFKEGALEVKLPEIKAPKVTVEAPKVDVKVPDIKIPKIKVPKPEVTVNVPEQKAPIVNVEPTPVEFPEFMDVGLQAITPKRPLHVMPVDPKGNYVDQTGGGGGRTLPRKERVSAPKTDDAVEVTTASTQILAANAERHTFTVVNDSDAVIYLKYGGTAVMNSGIRLNANGGSHTDDVYIGELTGITAVGNKKVTIMEL